MTKALFQCPGCKEKQPLEFKKPGYYSSATLAVTCDGCDSKFKCYVTRPSRGKSAQMAIEPVFLSRVYKEMVKSRKILGGEDVRNG